MFTEYSRKDDRHETPDLPASLPDDALTALALDIVDGRMDYATFRMIDTTDQFTTPFRQGRESVTVNGATVRHSMIDLGDAYQVTVVFSNLNKKVY